MRQTWCFRYFLSIYLNKILKIELTRHPCSYFTLNKIPSLSHTHTHTHSQYTSAGHMGPPLYINNLGKVRLHFDKLEMHLTAFEHSDLVVVDWVLKINNCRDCKTALDFCPLEFKG